MTRLVHGQKPCAGHRSPVITQCFLKPVPIPTGKRQIFIQQCPVGDDGDGQVSLLGMNLQILRRRGYLRRVGEDRQISVGFQNGILNGADIQYVFFTEVAHQFIDGYPGAPEVVL